jgi:hypothetical protein
MERKRKVVKDIPGSPLELSLSVIASLLEMLVFGNC